MARRSRAAAARDHTPRCRCSLVVPQPCENPPSLLLELDRQSINLRRQDEVVLRKAIDGVGADFDSDVAEAGQVQVGVMVLGLCDLADALEEVEAGHEI